MIIYLENNLKIIKFDFNYCGSSKIQLEQNYIDIVCFLENNICENGNGIK